MIDKISLGIPVWRADIKREFLGSILANTILSPGLVKDAYIAANVNIAAARNEIVKNTQMPAIFMVDPDTVLPQKAIETLAKHDLPIVSGIVFKRTYPFPPSVYKKNEDGSRWIPIVDYPDTGLIEVEGIGSACMLVKREVFEKIGYPQFEYIEGIRSEDFDFCEKALQAGYKIFVDCSVKCGHMTETPINEQSFKAAVATQQTLKKPNTWQLNP